MRKSTTKIADRKKSIGQFFTPEQTADYMASMFSKETVGKEFSFIDPGAGMGTLTCALVTRLAKCGYNSIQVDLCETDLSIIPQLEENMCSLEKKAKANGILFSYKIITESFFSVYDKKYDGVIMNPPYKKIKKDEALLTGMRDVISGQPNLYFLFIEKAIRLLKQSGELCVICPRSWTSGAYFKLFRTSFLSSMNLQRVHLFRERNNVFGTEKVLQETMIFFAKKQPQQDTIMISSGTGLDFSIIHERIFPSDLCIPDDGNQFIFLPATTEQENAVRDIRHHQSSLRERGYILKTGPVVEFRNSEYLLSVEKTGYLPMIRPQHIKDSIVFPVRMAKAQYVSENAPDSIKVKNQNMVLMKRFATKEEKRRLQVAPYMKTLPGEYITIENHVNYNIVARKPIA